MGFSWPSPKEETGMVFAWTILLLSFFLPHSLQGVADAPDSKDVFVIAVDHSVKRENLQVRYFLTGDFGGYGDYKIEQDGENKILIHTEVEGKPAKSLKAVLYAPHCHIQTVSVDDLRESRREDEFHCIPLGEIELRGKFDRDASDQDRKLEIRVSYLGSWGHAFFGISDGQVLTLEMGSAFVQRDGSFHMALPNFAEDIDSRFQRENEAFWMVVRDSETRNIVAGLEAPASLSIYGQLKIVSSYPSEVDFVAKRYK
jgi:hypothetical protein